MAKGMYIGVDGKARKAKKIYVGVSGKARKVKKAYIGVGGVARPFWSGTGEVLYYMESALSVARRKLSSATVGEYALIASGYGGTEVVDAYDGELVMSTPSELYCQCCGGSSLGDCAIFVSPYFAYENGTLYTSDLTRKSIPTRSVFTGIGDDAVVCTPDNSYVISAGANDTGGVGYSASADAFDAERGRTVLSDLSVARTCASGATAGEYTLIAGGSGSDTSASTTVDAYDSDLIRTTATQLSVAISCGAGTTLDRCAIFAGSSSSADINVFDENLVRITPSQLSQKRSYLAATTLDQVAIFGGGYYGGTGDRFDTVDLFDSDFVRIESNIKLADARCALTAVSTDKYAFFAGGGYTASSRNMFKTVDIFTI